VVEFLDHASREQVATAQRLRAEDAVRDALAALAEV
jgi:1-deoxy-D-xylulose-5-phosphate synthase